MKHFKCFDKDGRMVGTIMAKDEKAGLELAQKRNKAVVRVGGDGGKLPDVSIPNLKEKSADELKREAEEKAKEAEAAKKKEADEKAAADAAAKAGGAKDKQ